MAVIKKGKKDKNKGGKAMSDADVKNFSEAIDFSLPPFLGGKAMSDADKKMTKGELIKVLKSKAFRDDPKVKSMMDRMILGIRTKKSEDKSDAKETAIKRRIPGKKTGGKVKKRKGYKLGAKVERAERDPRAGYGYDTGYYGNQRRPKTL